MSKEYTEEHLNSPETFSRMRRGLLRIQGRSDPNLEIVCRNVDLDVGEFTAFVKHHFGSPANISLVNIRVLERKVFGDAPGEPTGEDAPEIEVPAVRKKGVALFNKPEPDPTPEEETIRRKGPGRKKLTEEERKAWKKNYMKAYWERKNAAKAGKKKPGRKARAVAKEEPAEKVKRKYTRRVNRFVAEVEPEPAPRERTQTKLEIEEGPRTAATVGTSGPLIVRQHFVVTLTMSLAHTG